MYAERSSSRSIKIHNIYTHRDFCIAAQIMKFLYGHVCCSVTDATCSLHVACMQCNQREMISYA